MADVARCVATALKSADIRAVLTGGACASLHTRGGYKSSDLDFIIQNAVSGRQLDRTMSSIGFRRLGNQYEHPDSPFFVEFPAGPLGIGGDLHIRPVEYRIKGTVILALSAADSCRDRLVAFYHWDDRQALRVAVSIARRNRVNLASIRRWSEHEGARSKCEEFLSEVKRTAARGQGRRRSR